MNYWDTVSNRRELFLKYAREKGFDPLVVDNWYSVQKEDFVTTMKVLYKTNINSLHYAIDALNCIIVVYIKIFF